MPTVTGNDAAIRNILRQSRVIAVVGHSDKPDRTSYQIAQFLLQVGYVVFPVNPSVTEIDGKPSYPSLLDVPEPIDIVNVFRRSEYLSDVVDEAISAQAKTVWAQLGVQDEAVADKANAAGLNLIMNTCIKIEYRRLNIQTNTL